MQRRSDLSRSIFSFADLPPTNVDLGAAGTLSLPPLFTALPGDGAVSYSSPWTTRENQALVHVFHFADCNSVSDLFNRAAAEKPDEGTLKHEATLSSWTTTLPSSDGTQPRKAHVLATELTENAPGRATGVLLLKLAFNGACPECLQLIFPQIMQQFLSGSSTVDQSNKWRL